MKMMDELKPLFLYPNTMKVYAPVNEKDKRRGAAIMLLTKDATTSSNLMRLPYIYNPNLFTAYYVDRNVTAYIDNMGIENIDFDEKEAEAISEGIIFSSVNKTKIKFSDKTTVSDTRRIEDIINFKEIEYFAKNLKINNTPSTIKVEVYPSVSSLRAAAPKNLQNVYGDHLYSFIGDGSINVISYAYFDEELMGGNYAIYLKKILYQYLIEHFNEDIPTTVSHAIASGLSGQVDWIKEHKYTNKYNLGEFEKFAQYVAGMDKHKAYQAVRDYIKTGNMGSFKRFYAGSLKRLIFDESLSYMERQRLLPSEFGIPNKRKYPMHDEEHVHLALKMFNHCDADEEEDLAKAIVRKAKSFGITELKASAANRFRKFYNPKTLEPIDKSDPVNESSELGTDYLDVVKICNNLTPNELSRITFYDTYRNSPFVAKRIIKRVGPEPAGFVDAYVFPSNPDLAQIVIAVDSKYRGQHIADEMVDELINSDLHKSHGFKMYYWTAHPDNVASQSLALKHGFTDINQVDKYGRKIFTKVVQADPLIWNEIPGHMKPAHSSEACVETDLSFVADGVALLNEGSEKEYSMRLRKYLYSERIKNNKEAILLYDRIKQSNPDIKKTYIKLDMYKEYNLFVDLYYYHQLFLKNNATKLDKAVHFYFEFINRLINNGEVRKIYKKQTIFIPIELSAWDVANDVDLCDYKKSLNPISIICRLVRTDLEVLRKAWGNKSIIFVGLRGYFTVNFKDFDMKKLARFKANIKKLTSSDPIVDDYEVDPDMLKGNDVDTPKAKATKIIDSIEKGAKISIDNISALEPDVQPMQHLTIQKGILDIDQNLAKEVNGIAIVALDVDDNHENLSNTVFSKAKKIDTFCLPNK